MLPDLKHLKYLQRVVYTASEHDPHQNGKITVTASALVSLPLCRKIHRFFSVFTEISITHLFSIPALEPQSQPGDHAQKLHIETTQADRFPQD